MSKMNTLTINNTTYDIVDDGAVRFDSAQTLTDEQKAQARENIGAKSDGRTISIVTTNVVDKQTITDCSSGEISIITWNFPDGASEMDVTSRRSKNIVDPSCYLYGRSDQTNWLNDYTGLYKGATLTRQGNIFIVSGTPTSNMNIYIITATKPIRLSAGTYRFIGCPSGGGSGKYAVQWKNADDDQHIGYDYGDGLTITFDTETNVRCTAIVYSGYEVDGLTFCCQITEGVKVYEYEEYCGNTITLSTDSIAPVSGLLSYEGYTAIECNSGGTVTVRYSAISGGDDTVRFTEQNLTEEQKAQARENIGAAQSGNICLVMNELTDESIILGNFVLKDGNLQASDTYVCTDYIDISEAIDGTDIMVSTCLNGYASVVFYNSEKNVVSFINGRTAEESGYTQSSAMQEVTITKTADITYYRASACVTGTYTQSSDFYYSYTADVDLNKQIKNIDNRLSKIEGTLGYTDSLKAVYIDLQSSNDFTFVGDELWCGKINYTTGATEIRRYVIENGVLVYKSSIATDFGHLNTFDYDPINDCLIFGNGANDTNTEGNFFAVVPHPLSLGESATLADNAIIYNVDIGYKVQAVWGDANCGNHNIAILFANDARNIVKVLLTRTNGDFDGSFIVLETKELEEVIGVQGADYYGDTLYIGNDTYNIACMSMSDYSVKHIKKQFYMDDGTAFTGAMQGVYIDKDYEWWFFNIGNNSNMTKALLQYHR